jgi:mono/diheme cytochrome c family protein
LKRAACVALLTIAACGDRQVFHAPSPTLARMLDQRRADPYEPSGVFADGKVMRDPPRGTVPRDDEESSPPPPVTRELVAEGRERFDVVCAACHGIRGDGASAVATKMEHRPPPSLHEPRVRALSREQIFAIVTRGYGLMPAHGELLAPRERWRSSRTCARSS